MLKRQDLVNSILDVFDYIDVLKAENENLKNNVPKVKSEDKNVTFIDAIMIEEGKKSLKMQRTIGTKLTAAMMKNLIHITSLHLVIG